MRTIPKTLIPLLVMFAIACGTYCAGIVTGLNIPHTTTQHADTRWTIPAPCKGCGYEVTTYYPDHKAQTVNYFSGGGQQVTWTGVWVRGGVNEGTQK